MTSVPSWLGEGVAAAPTTALADVLALRGETGWLSPPLVELSPAEAPVVGTAVTVRIEPGAPPGGGAFEPLYALLDADLTGRVVVLAELAEIEGAVWGQILSRAALRAGVMASLVDGAVRDRTELFKEGLPVWGRRETTVGGIGAAHVGAIDIPVQVGSATVEGGDVIVVDRAGVVAIARDSAAEVNLAACSYARAEELLLADLRRGVPLVQAYERKRGAMREVIDSL